MCVTKLDYKLQIASRIWEPVWVTHSPGSYIAIANLSWKDLVTKETDRSAISSLLIFICGLIPMDSQGRIKLLVAFLRFCIKRNLFTWKEMT